MATCTGTPTDPRHTTCDLDATTDGIAECPEGCDYNEGETEPEPFTNLFPQMNLSQNCMILIVILLVLILFKDQIMKSSVVKSISKSLK